MSLKSRIREAQRAAARRLKPDPRRDAGGKDAAAMMGSKDGAEDKMKEAAPTVEEIRITLLRKSTNGKNTL